MSDTLKPGEYLNYYGDLRDFHVKGDVVIAYAEDQVCSVSDARAAGKALIALADELETEYVELAPAWRIVLLNGEAVQVESYGSDGWAEAMGNAGNLALRAYRAGLERGRA